MRPWIAVFAVLAVACSLTVRNNDAIESMLSEIAQYQRQTAERTLDPRDFAAAADAYEQLLDEVPKAAPRHRWDMAESQLRAGRYQQAAASYETLIGTPYEDVAVYMSYRCWHLIAFRDVGIHDRPEWSNQPLTASQQAFVDSVGRLLTHEFAPQAPAGVPDFSLAAMRFRPAMLLESAELLLAHDRQSDAEPLLEELLTEHAESPHARQARQLLRARSGS